MIRNMEEQHPIIILYVVTLLEKHQRLLGVTLSQ